MATVLVQTTAKYGFADGKLCFQTDVVFVLFCFVFFLRTLLREVHRKHVYLGKEEKELPNKPFFLLFVNKNVSYFEERPFLPLLSQT